MVDNEGVVVLKQQTPPEVNSGGVCYRSTNEC